MKIFYNDAQKIAEIWVPTGTDESLVRDAWRNVPAGYQTVVYRSGSGDLTALTSQLLEVNK